MSELLRFSWKTYSGGEDKYVLAFIFIMRVTVFNFRAQKFTVGRYIDYESCVFES